MSSSSALPSIRDQLFAKLSSPTVAPVEFCGIKCFMRRWSHQDRINWGEYIKSIRKDDNSPPEDDYMACRALSLSLSDAGGALVFTADDVKEIAKFDGLEIERVFDIVIEYQTVKPVDAKKNSPTTPSLNSTSDSPSTSTTPSATSSNPSDTAN